MCPVSSGHVHFCIVCSLRSIFFYLCLSVIIPVCTWCGSLQIYQRGLPPGGGGKVYFSCPIVKRMKPLLLNEVGKVKRVRGVSYLLSTVYYSHFLSAYGY